MHASIFFKVLNVLNSPFQSSPYVHAFCDRLWLCPLPSNCMTFQKKRISEDRGRVSADLLPSLSLSSASRQKAHQTVDHYREIFFMRGKPMCGLHPIHSATADFFFRRNNSGKTVVPPLVQFSLKIYFCRPSRCYQSWSEGKSRRGPAHRFLPLKIK